MKVIRIAGFYSVILGLIMLGLLVLSVFSSSIRHLISVGGLIDYSARALLIFSLIYGGIGLINLQKVGLVIFFISVPIMIYIYSLHLDFYSETFRSVTTWLVLFQSLVAVGLMLLISRRFVRANLD